MTTKPVLVTTTLYKSPDEVRCRLALKTVEASVAYGYPIIVVDGSPDPRIRRMLAAGGAVVFEQLSGMGRSRRQAIQAGLDWCGGSANVIGWLEEKYPIVPLLQPLIDAVASGYWDMMIPWRKRLDSYPRYQAASEQLANLALGAITGRNDLDLCFGPRVMSRAMAAEFCRYDGRYGDNWESIFIPVLAAIREGKRVGSIAVDYVHPAEQTAAEEGDLAMDAKRDQQRLDLVAAMARAAQEMGFYPRLAGV